MIELMDIESGDVVAATVLPTTTAAFVTGESPTDTFVLCDTHAAYLLAASDLALTDTIQLGSALPADLSLAATCSRDGQVTLLRPGGEMLTASFGGHGLLRRRRLPLGSTTCIARSPRGDRLLVGGEAGLVWVADDGSGLTHRTIPNRPDHRFIAGGHEGSWVCADAHPEAVDRPAGSLWINTADGYEATDRLRLSPTSMGGSDHTRPDLYGRYEFAPGHDGHAIQFFDVFTGTGASAVIDKGLASSGIAVDPHARWCVFDNGLPETVAEIGRAHV